MILLCYLLRKPSFVFSSEATIKLTLSVRSSLCKTEKCDFLFAIKERKLKFLVNISMTVAYLIYTSICL